MTAFRYRAFTAAGEEVGGEIDAGNRAAALEAIQRLGHLPFEVEEAGTAHEEHWWRRDLFGSRVTPAKLARVTRELATLVSARLPLDEALEIMAAQGGDSASAQALSKVRSNLLDGASLSDALARQPEAFPAFYVSAVRAGEAGGALGSVLERMASHLERSEMVKAKLRSALIYPAIVMAMAVVSLVLVMTVVMPGFEPLFAGAGRKLPFITQIVIAVSNAVQVTWKWALLALGVGALAAARAWRDPDKRKAVHALMLRAPLMGGHIAKAEAARFCRTLSTLIENGVGLPRALDLAREGAGNLVFAHAIAVLHEGVREGAPLARLMREAGIFPELAVKLAAVGERTGRLGEMLERAAGVFEVETERGAERFLSILTPAVTVFLGLVIGTIILSVVMAVFSLNDFAF